MDGDGSRFPWSQKVKIDILEETWFIIVSLNNEWSWPVTSVISSGSIWLNYLISGDSDHKVITAGYLLLVQIISRLNNLSLNQNPNR